jgi:hypothetical protein
LRSSPTRLPSLILLLAAASLACALPFGTPSQGSLDTIATSVAATLTAAVPPSPLPPTATAPPAVGAIAGNICYPSEGIPAMTAFFEEINNHTVTSLPIAASQGSYQVELPPGVYHAYAWQAETGSAGSYSQAVPCGLDASCTDHSLIDVTVAAGSTTGGVDLCDWYGGPGSVPTPPGGLAAAPPPTATLTPGAPPGGVSLNCDGTYQRVRITDAGAAGKTAWVDSWTGMAWVNMWSYVGGDAMVRQIEDDAGAYQFLGCQRLVILPLRYTGSGANLELLVFVWVGATMNQVYQHSGVHGTWTKIGDTLTFEESIYLFGEPNCCPCNRQTLQHTWNGSAFLQTGISTSPTYPGTPPPECG